MSQLFPPSAADRPDSRLSLALSDTTFHSFNDGDLPEPRHSQQATRPMPNHTVHTPTTVKHHKIPTPGEMRRQDSGYESLDRRDSSTSSTHRASTVSVTSSTKRRRARPSAPRSCKSGPVSHLPRHTHSRHSLSPTRSHHNHHRVSPSHEPASVYFHFPHFAASEPALETSEPTKPGFVAMAMSHESGPDHPLPQTTHYWTSDRTRRLEYAAIDAASRGVRGWVMRHVVPDCFVPKSKRRVGFEDDTGSVVRYRLDLEDDQEEKPRGRRWWLGGRVRGD